MTVDRQGRWWVRGVVWTLLLALVMPWLAGCATVPGAGGIRLVAIVVDGGRVASEDEAPAMLRVWRDGQAIAVRRGMRLEEGDRISTHERAEAVIRFPNGSELYLGRASRGRIGSFTEALGEMFAKVWGVFSIETEYVKAGARGTAFGVRAAPDGRTEVLVLNGSVEVSSRSNAWRPLLLQAGAATIAHPQAPRPRQASPAELEAAQASIDRLQRLVPAETSGAGGAAAAALAIGAAAAILFGSRDDKPATGDRPPDRRPGAEPPLAAPTGLRPGSPEPQRAPLLDCREPLPLAWQPVAGARDYLVTLQSLPLRATEWQTVATPASAQPGARAPAGLNGRMRWWVRARDGRGEGPASPTLYLNCTTSVLR